MKDYTYTLTRKYPFIKKKPLTQTEIIRKRYMDYFNILPVVYTIIIVVKIYYWCKKLIKTLENWNEG